MSLWLYFLAKCKTFNIVDVGGRKYLFSKFLMVNPIVAKQIYMISELCTNT